jgi:hypothetical protein
VVTVQPVEQGLLRPDRQRHLDMGHPLRPVNGRRREKCRCGLFDGDRIGEVAGLVDVVALGLGERCREYL